MRFCATRSVVGGLLLFSFAGCSGTTIKSYVKQDGPWDVIQRVAVLPFETPTENVTRRNLVTHIFTQELRNAGVPEVIEVPLSDPMGMVPDLKEVASQYEVDAVFFGSIDETYGTVVHVRLLDAATSDVLWSATYLLGARAEFFSMKTTEQRYQRAFARLIQKFVRETALSTA